MDLYVHIATGAAIGALAKSTANLVFSALDEECDQSISCKLAHAIEWATVYGAGFTGGLISHAVQDALPHGDYLAYYGWLLPDSLWVLRELIAAVVVLLLIMVVLRGRNRLVALVAGIGGVIPELDNLAIGMGWINRSQAISPSHSGVWAHGQNLGWVSFALEIGLFFLAMIFLLVFGWQQSRRCASTFRQSGKARYVASGRVEELHTPPVFPSSGR